MGELQRYFAGRAGSVSCGKIAPHCARGSGMPRSSKTKGTSQGVAPRYGIGEWYGKLLTGLSEEDRKHFASQPSGMPCPFKQVDLVKPGTPALCKKRGGICSLRLYERDHDGTARVASGSAGVLRSVCPFRLHENKTIVTWVSETLLGISDPLIATEIGFLEPLSDLVTAQPENEDPAGDEAEDLEAKRDVGRLDLVLMDKTSTGTGHIKWCVVEIQAVYFSGKGMQSYFDSLGNHTGNGTPFPDKPRRPDYRSSGPKRLMPQLQIKVPTLRRWGKKMAVVVDRGFIQTLGPMDKVPDVSNCDIAWFIVDYRETENGTSELVKSEVRFTTLERSVDGLTAGRPVSLSEFESRIKGKLERRQNEEARVARRLARKNEGLNI